MNVLLGRARKVVVFVGREKGGMVRMQVRLIAFGKRSCSDNLEKILFGPNAAIYLLSYHSRYN